MALGVSETDATESVTQMVNQYSKDSFDLEEKVRKNIEAFNWKSYKDRQDDMYKWLEVGDFDPE
jgi:hypothetical protein